MSFDGNRWRGYTVEENPLLGSDNYYRVSIGRNNAKWVSNWGVGVALLDDHGDLEKVFSIANGLPPSLTPPDNQSYVVVGGVTTDENGITWIADRTPPGDTALVTVRPDETLGYVTGFATRSPYVTFTDIVIDFNRTKWFTNFGRFEPSHENRSTGLYYYNENAILPGGGAHWGKLIQQDGLMSENIYSLAVDRDGALWIGTDNGITIMFDPSNPRGSILPYHPLQQSTQLIQAIVVDPLNNKWIGTKQGVFLYSADGTVILDHYTVSNTDGKLLDDDIASIAINPSAGTVYFGTEKGLSSLSTYAVSPTRSFEELRFSPNPFYLPSSATLTVSGLVQGSTLKILSIDGALVREIQTPGGGVGFWDGKDLRGALASTGVYIVVGYSEDGTKVATGKIAVIRR
jgi:hypothetical protein